MTDPPLALVVLISGRGTNLQAILDEVAAGRLPVVVRAVVSNRPDAAGLERARRAGVETRVIDHRPFPTREAFDRALAEAVDGYRPGLVVLAGFMRVLTATFIERFEGRLLNVHPSLLPRFRGLDTHARALAEGVGEHGTTVHFVTPELDAGPVVVQGAVPVLPQDDVDTLAARVLREEHRVLPLAIRWFAEGRLELRRGTVLLDGGPVPPTGVAT